MNQLQDVQLDLKKALDSQSFVSINKPERVGSGLNAYMLYNVYYKINIANSKLEGIARRRYRDFLMLHDQLIDRYAHCGYVVPPVPGKCIHMSSKVKLRNLNTNSHFEIFIEQRRAALERFLNYIIKHEVFQLDPLIKEFLQTAEDLPHSKKTSLLSPSGLKKVVRDAAEQFPKFRKSNETDMWFEMKQTQIGALELHLRRFLKSIECHISDRKKIAKSGDIVSCNLALLNQFEFTGETSITVDKLSNALMRISTIDEESWKLDQLILGDLAREYIGLISSIQKCFDERERTFKCWQKLQGALILAREKETKAQAQGKADKLLSLQTDIKCYTDQANKTEEDYDKISENIVKELKIFDKIRNEHFLIVITKYLNTKLNQQHRILSVWQEYLTEKEYI